MPAEAKLEIVLTRKPGEQPTPRSSGIATADDATGTRIAPAVASKTAAEQTSTHREEFREVLNKIHQEHLEAIKALISRNDMGKVAEHVTPAKIATAAQKEREKLWGPEENYKPPVAEKIKEPKQEKTPKPPKPEESEGIKNLLERNKEVQNQFMQFIANLASQNVGGVVQQAGGLAQAYAYRTEQKANEKIVADGAVSQGSTAMLNFASKAAIAGGLLVGFGESVKALIDTFKTRSDEVSRFSAPLTRNRVMFQVQDIMRDVRLARTSGDEMAKAELFFRRMENWWKDIKDDAIKVVAFVGAIAETIEQMKPGSLVDSFVGQLAQWFGPGTKAIHDGVKLLNKMHDRQAQNDIDKKTAEGKAMLVDMMMPPVFGNEADKPRRQQQRVEFNVQRPPGQ